MIPMFKFRYSIKNMIFRCLIIIMGIAIAAVSTPLLIYGNLGSDPFTAFNQGLSLTAGISYGQAVILFNGVLLIFVLILNRKMIHMGTILYLILMGPLSDLFLNLFSFLEPMNLSIPIRTILMILGIICVGVGLGVYQAADLGAGPADAFNQITAEKLKIKLRTERICYDGILVISAFFLHGVIGVGTIAGIVMIGPIMAPTFKNGSQLINKIAS